MSARRARPHRSLSRVALVPPPIVCRANARFRRLSIGEMNAFLSGSNLLDGVQASSRSTTLS